MTSHPSTDSGQDPASSLRQQPGPSSAAGSTITAPDGAAGSEAVISPREEVVVRPGRFSVHRLRLTPHPSEALAPSPCATPPAPSRFARLSRLHCRQGPLRASAPSGSLAAATPGSKGILGGSGVSLGAGASPTGIPAATASGAWPTTPPSAPRPSSAAGPSGIGGCSEFTRGSLFPRPRSLGSATPAHSGPPSTRSTKLPPQSFSAANPSTPAGGYGSGYAAGSAVFSSELVVAVKRIGYGRIMNRSGGGGRGREPDGCAACTGGAIGRGRGGSGPSRTRLSRMQAIELLQLARCRECPFIVRVFGCVQDDARSVVASATAGGGDDGVGGGGGGGNAASGVAAVSKQSLRPSKLSPRRPQPPASSSPSCRIVMEWAEGGDLGSLIKALSSRRGPCSDPSRERLLMSETSARFYLACLVEALSFLHGKGLLHRDVKPANLLLTSDGRAKLGDLGMVCHLDRDGMAAGRAGTPNYMAPEVWAYGTGPKYSSYSANADLWSAGVVLYELLTGHLPESHPDEYLRRSWSFTPRHAAFSAELRDLLGRLVMPRPRRRLQSCAELVAHPWFAGFDWQGLRDGTLPAPYVPAAHRPPPSTATHLLASASSITAGVGLMPPLLEENGPSGAAATTGSSRGTGSYAAAAVRAILRVPSAGALRQSATAVTVAGTMSTGTPTVPSQAGPVPTASLSGQPAVEFQACLVSSAGGAVRHGQQSHHASSPLSPAAAAAGPLSVWRSLGWPAPARSSPAGTSAPASATSSTMSLSAACVASPQGTWLRRGASYASGYVRDVCTAASTAGGGGGSFGFIGPALASVLSPVLASPKSPNIVRATSATAVASGSGRPGLNPEGVASTRVGSSVAAEAVAGTTDAIRTTSGSPPPLAGYGNGGDCARVAPAICSCAFSASETPTTSHSTSPFLLSTAAAATGTDFALRGDSGTFPAGSDSSGGALGGRGPSHGGPNCTGTGGVVVWQPTPPAVRLVGSIESQPPTNSMPPAHPQGQRFGLLGYSPSSGESSACLTQNLSQIAADTSTPGPCNALSVCSGPSLSSSTLAATAPQPGLLSALASLQHHVQGLGPTGRRAGWWLQQRLADAATLAATLPDQLHFAAAAAAAVMGGKVGENVDGRSPTAAMERLCKSDSGASPRGGGAAAHCSTRVVRSVVVSGTCAGDVLHGQCPSDTEGDCGNEDIEAESLAEARMCGRTAPLQQSPPVASSAEVRELAAATYGSRDNKDYGKSLPPADATDVTSAPTGNVPAAAASSVVEAPQNYSCQMAAPCWITSSRRTSSGELSDGSHNSSRRAPWPAVPPLLLSLPPSLPHGMAEVTGGGADAATVVVLVRRSTGSSGAAVDAGDNMIPVVCERSPCGGAAISGVEGASQGMGEKPVHLVQGDKAVGSYPPTAGVQECGAGATGGAVTTATEGVTPRRRDPLASPRLAAARNPPLAHKRTGSFCFDPLDQARSASQPTASSATPRPSTQPSTPGRTRVRGTSFSFDVGGLLSAGLLLGGSPALLAEDASGAVCITSEGDVLSGHASADACSKPRSFSVGSACANPTAAAVVALAAVADVAAATFSRGQPSPQSPRLLQPPNYQPGSVAAKKSNGGSPDGPGPNPSVSAIASLTSGPGSDPNSRTPTSVSGSGPVTTLHDSGRVAQAHQLQPRHPWHQWQAGEAVALLYAACVAVLVMAWAVILEGPDVNF
ncbi:hypothetical protein Vafri_15253 [Volvox africanus]|nr:hypothetical protein Vafri_15253 [Volvox africanus]